VKYALVLLAGCGRIGFDAVPVDAPAPDLVAWYAFDGDPAGTAVDGTSHQLDGTCSPATTCPAAIAGVHGSAVMFDGVDDCFTVPDPGTLQLRTGFTVSLWVMAATVVDGTVISKPLAIGTGASFELVSRPAGLTFFGQDGASETFIMGPVLALDTWTHVAISWDGTTRRLFVDGSEDAEGASAAAWDSTPLQIGCDREDGSEDGFFPGAIDDVRIYGRALTGTEIAALP
jgi:hypothetical protein